MYGVKLYLQAVTPIIKKYPPLTEPATLPYLAPSVYSPQSHSISLNIHFNGILQFVPPEWYRPVSFSDSKILCISRLPHVCYMPVRFLAEVQTGTKLQDED